MNYCRAKLPRPGPGEDSPGPGPEKLPPGPCPAKLPGISMARSRSSTEKHGACPSSTRPHPHMSNARSAANPARPTSICPTDARHVFRGWLKPEMHRLLTHSSSSTVWLEGRNNFNRHLHKRGYPAGAIDSCFN
jgi:hypothetical protein